MADAAATGQQLADAWFAAIKSGEPAKVAAVLSPSAQIVRANGDVVRGDEYLKQIPVIKDYALSKIQATQSGDILMVSYQVTVDEVVNGVAQPTKVAPRLSVFQQQGEKWLLIAHANFGAINR